MTEPAIRLRSRCPILARHDAPFTVFVTTGFADRGARMWWLELEEAIGVLDHVEDRGRRRVRIDMPARTPARKVRVPSRAVYRQLRAAARRALLAACRTLCEQARLDPAAIVDEACLTWHGVARLRIIRS